MSQRREPVPAPRYDDVFTKGVEWLDGLAGPLNDEKAARAIALECVEAYAEALRRAFNAGIIWHATVGESPEEGFAAFLKAEQGR